MSKNPVVGSPAGRSTDVGRVLRPAVVLACVADLLVDRVFGNRAVNLLTFGVVFAVVVVVRYSQRTDWIGPSSRPFGYDDFLCRV